MQITTGRLGYVFSGGEVDGVKRPKVGILVPGGACQNGTSDLSRV